MKVFRKKCRAKDRKEVGTSNNAIKMNYRKAAMITLKFRMYNPHTSFIIWFTPDWNKPMYKCTWVMLVMKKMKRTKVPSQQASHTSLGVLHQSQQTQYQTVGTPHANLGWTGSVCDTSPQCCIDHLGHKSRQQQSDIH